MTDFGKNIYLVGQQGCSRIILAHTDRDFSVSHDETHGKLDTKKINV